MCGGQRTTLDISPHFPSCLKQTLCCLLLVHQASWPKFPSIPLSLPSISSKIIDVHHCVWLYTGSRELDSDPNACPTSDFSGYHPPSPDIFFQWFSFCACNVTHDTQWVIAISFFNASLRPHLSAAVLFPLPGLRVFAGLTDVSQVQVGTRPRVARSRRRHNNGLLEPAASVQSCGYQMCCFNWQIIIEWL